MSKKRGCLGATIISVCVLMAIGIIGAACDGGSGKEPIETTAVTESDTIRIIDMTTTGDDTFDFFDERFDKKDDITSDLVTEVDEKKYSEQETVSTQKPVETKPTAKPVITPPESEEAEKPHKQMETKAEEQVKPTQSNSAITVISDPSPVTRNEEATLMVKGAPNSDAYIYVYYSSGASKAKGLDAKTTDADGYVSWTWKIGIKTKAGTYSITVKIGDDEIDIPLVVKE